MLTDDVVQNLHGLAGYARSLRGDEKGEAQVFCDRLFRAFGHERYKEAGTTLECRVRSTFLLALNERLADYEANGDFIVGPSLPFSMAETKPLVTDDRTTIG